MNTPNIPTTEDAMLHQVQKNITFPVLSSRKRTIDYQVDLQQSIPRNNPGNKYSRNQNETCSDKKHQLIHQYSTSAPVTLPNTSAIPFSPLSPNKIKALVLRNESTSFTKHRSISRNALDDKSEKRDSFYERTCSKECEQTIQKGSSPPESSSEKRNDDEDDPSLDVAKSSRSMQNYLLRKPKKVITKKNKTRAGVPNYITQDVEAPLDIVEEVEPLGSNHWKSLGCRGK